jgi:hypothetical protein
MRKVGIRLLVIAYALVLYMSLAAPAYARTHQYLGPTMLAQYAAPWPVALACTVSIAGLGLALIPIRRGELWAVWLSALMWILLVLTRLTTDPRCLVVLDPHQHGCHTFMIAALLAIVGLVLAR